MYRRNGKSILLLRRLLSERLRLGPASSARPPQSSVKCSQLHHRTPAWRRIAQTQTRENRARVTSKIKETQVHNNNLTQPFSSDLKPTTATLTPYDVGGEWTTNTQRSQQTIGKSNPCIPLKREKLLSPDTGLPLKRAVSLH